MADKVTNIIEHMPHVTIMLGENCVIVMPQVVLERVASGTIEIEEMEGWRPIVRRIIGEWLENLKDGTP